MPGLLHPATVWGGGDLSGSSTRSCTWSASRGWRGALLFTLGAGLLANNVPVKEFGMGDLPEMLEG